jgi:hypothetical protein
MLMHVEDAYKYLIHQDHLMFPNESKKEIINK